MAVKARYDYRFPSADRQELFGQDLLVYLTWRGNPLLCSAACFRVPQSMSWAEFRASMVDPWAGSDPDYDPARVGDWRLMDQPLHPQDDRSLAELGVGHKSMLSFA